MSNNGNVGKVLNIGGGFPRAKFEKALSGKQDKLTGAPGQVVGFDAEGNAIAKTAEQAGFLPITGGTLTGDLTGKYITGTWLQTTAAGHLGAAATKIPVLDSAGWIYYRTAQEIRSDIGAMSKSDVESAINAAITGAINASY